MNRLMRAALTLLFFGTIAGVVYAIYTGALVVPARWNPWAPLDVHEPLNWLTRFKLDRAGRDRASCLGLLDQANWQYRPVPDRDGPDGCGWTDAVRVEVTSAKVGAPFTLSCRSALSLALWEHHVVQTAAHAHFDVPVTRLEHYGSYACRNVYGRKDARVSRHASADALDVAGFVLANGRRIRVSDWADSGNEGAFLRDVHSGACKVFDSVLGPEYNAAHRDHFHLERGASRICR